MTDIEALAERVARAIRYADGYVLTDFAVGLVKAGMAEAQKLPAAPRDAGERLEPVIEGLRLIEGLLIGERHGTEPPSKYAADKARDIAAALRRRLTQKEPT